MTNRPILRFIQQHGSVRISDIAGSFGMPYPTVQNVIHELTREGFIAIVRHCTLPEAIQYRLTPAGIAFLRTRMEVVA